jgi:CRISPR/Cas system-associated protein Cas7 (RAMP superfamily)
MESMDWIDLAQNRDRRVGALLKAVMNLLVP